MNRATIIIRLAKQAGIDAESDTLCRNEGWVEPMEQFAALIEAEALKAHQQAIEAAVLAEREACAEACRGANPDAAMRRKFGDKAPYIACQNAIEARTQPMRIEDARKEET